MRYGVIVLWAMFWSVTSASAQVSIGIGLPSVSIGINLPVYPELVPVPNYPVYYAPRLRSNFFFYDGMYWVYQEDNWYASSWYNGPWGLVGPEVVPLFVLRIPVRYYRNPPVYFRGWRSDAPPRWGQHWGNEWQQRRSGWDKWNRRSAPPPAPLPVYQRQYSGDRYPRVEQQQVLRTQNYHYQPRNAVVRQHFQAQTVPSRAPQGASQDRSPRPSDIHRPTPPPPLQKAGPAAKPAQRGGEDVRRPAPPQNPPKPSGPPVQDPRRPPQQRVAPPQHPPQQNAPPVQDRRRQPQQGVAQPAQQTPRPDPKSVPQGKGAPQESRRQQGQERDREKGEERGGERGQERNK